MTYSVSVTVWGTFNRNLLTSLCLGFQNQKPGMMIMGQPSRSWEEFDAFMMKVLARQMDQVLSNH